MNKFLAALLILVIILIAAFEIILPRTVASILKEQVTKSTHAQEVEISLDSSPNAKMALGIFDTVHATASAGDIGDVEFQSLTLDGENINVDVKELLFPGDKLTAKQRTEKILKSAGRVELKGIITQDGLKNFIEKKVDQLDNAEIKITPQEVTAKGQIKFMGKTADVDIAGSFFLDENDVYFRATRLDVRNTLLRHVQIDRYLGDIKILQSETLPLNLKFSAVQMRDGDVLITAVRN